MAGLREAASTAPHAPFRFRQRTNKHAVSPAQTANNRHASSGTTIARIDIVIAPKRSVPANGALSQFNCRASQRRLSLRERALIRGAKDDYQRQPDYLAVAKH